jgi:hypothetical protein
MLRFLAAALRFSRDLPPVRQRRRCHPNQDAVNSLLQKNKVEENNILSMSNSQFKSALEKSLKTAIGQKDIVWNESFVDICLRLP